MNYNLTISNDLFLKLHNLQLNLIKNSTKQNINDYYLNLINLFESEQFTNQSNEYENSNDSTKLIEFFLIPILTLLKSRSNHLFNSDQNELLLKTCCLVLTKFKLNNLSLFYDLLNISSILLSKYKQTSEEFLITCFKLIQILFTRSSRDKILENFYKFINLTTIGLLVSISLDTLIDSNSLQVRLESIQCLKCLSNFKRLNYENNLVIKQDLIGILNYQNRIAILFASFLPGISIKLIQKFLLEQNFKLLNHKLICECLELYSHIISLVLNDYLLDETKFKSYFKSCFKDNDDETNDQLSSDIKTMIINRCENKEWTQRSCDRIFVLIERLLDSLITHDNYNVKLALVKFSSIISNQCYLTLNKYLSKLLKIMVTYAANNDYDIKSNQFKLSISDEALKSIDQLEKKEIKLNNNENVIKYLALNRFSVMDSCFEEILLKLPRIMKSKMSNKNELNDEYRLSHLKTLYGYLKLIDHVKMNEFFQLNLNNLNQLLEGLISCVSFDYKNLTNFYEIKLNDNLMDLSKSTLSNYTGLQTYLDDKIIYEQLSLICAYLGQSDSIRLIIDQLLNSDLIYFENFHFKIEIMFLINLILNGLSIKENNVLNKQEITSIINLILSNFLNDFNSLTDDRLDTIETVELLTTTTNKRNQFIIQTCLTLESIRISSKCLDSNDYNIFLIDTLYFTLENYLNTNLLIRSVSTQCLHELASNLNYKNIQSLLSINFDYLMNDLILKSSNENRSFKFKQEQEQEQNEKQSSHIFVLCALLEISDDDLMPYLDRLINDYLISIEINPYDFNMLLGVCRIIDYMTRAMRRWYPIKFNFINYHLNNNNNNNSKEVDHLDEFTNLNLKQYVDNVKKKKDYTKNFLNTLLEIEESIKCEFEKDENNLNENKNEIDQEDESKTNLIPLNVKLQTKCLELCTHLISHPFRQVRLKIIDLIRELCKNLAEYTNEFLPLVHKLWSPICHRFSLDDLLVKSKIIYLLFDLSVLCNDFISSRFCKEFLPRLCLFMSEQAKLSLKTTKTNDCSADSTYIYSHAFKLQCSILSNIDKMCVMFDIKEMELENLIESILIIYLDRRQPKKLQYLALDAIQNCSLIDSDVVWLILHYILPISANETMYKNYSTSIKLKYNFQLNQEILLNLIELFNRL